MTWDWKHWDVKCRHCDWFVQYFPPDQIRDMRIERELEKSTCIECKGPVRVKWNE